jgi:hypothetical protein
VDFSQVWQTWLRVTTSPSEATFEAERQKPNATLSTALIWMLIAGVITAAVGLLQAALVASAAPGTFSLLLGLVPLPQVLRAAVQTLGGIVSVTGLSDANIGSIIAVPLGFLIVVTIFHWIAKLLGGTGNFGRFAYLNAAFSAPLAILVALISIIPYVNLLEIVTNIYQVVLIYYAIKVEHRLTKRKAVLVILLPVILLLSLIVCVGIFIGATAIMQNAQ